MLGALGRLLAGFGGFRGVTLEAKFGENAVFLGVGGVLRGV